MSKYEILTIVNGNLNEKQALEALQPSINVIKHNKDFEQINLGIKELAYKIKKFEKGWYIQLNFSTKIPNEINEFSRLSKLNNDIIRFLIINLDHDYGAKAINNPKKVKKAKKQLSIYKKKIKEIEKQKQILEEVKAATKEQEVKKEEEK